MAEKKELEIKGESEGVTVAGIELPEPDLEPVEESEPVTVTEPKRQRKPRQPRASKTETKLAVDTWAQKVVGIHMIAAKLAGNDVLLIDNAQARELTAAVMDVAQHYDLRPDPKVMAWLNLASIAALIYTPKVVAIAGAHKERARRERAARANAAASQVSSGESGLSQPGVVTFPSIN